jgi:phytoene dehydrogenase-like protein
MSQTQEPIVVVGGGLAGLAAAALAARGGVPVTLFEKASAVGGRASTQTRDGVALNQGPHALYRGGTGMKVLRELGIEPRGGMPNASGGHAVFEGRLHALPGGLVSLLTTGLLPLGAKLEVARLLAGLQRIDAAALAEMSVATWLDRTLRHEVNRRLVEALFRLATYVNDPEHLSAAVAVRQLQLALAANVLYLDGGWQTLVDGVRRAAEEAGVRIVAGARVAQLEHNNAVRAIVLADGSRHTARAVILAVDPATALAVLGDTADSALATYVRGTVPVEAACLDVVLARLPRPRSTFALGIDRPLYLSVHSAVARLAPSGQALIQLAKYLPPGGTTDGGRDEHELEGLLELVQPGWRGVVVSRRFLPHMTVVGAGADARHGGLAGRPGVVVAGMRGVYLAGDWVGAEGWLADASLGSARRAAHELRLRDATVRSAAA